MKNRITGRFVGERALFASRDTEVYSSVFEDGESPLKESRNISVSDSIFAWKYPLWYCRNVSVKGTVLLTTARSGIWYTHNISMTDCEIEAPKTFRRSSGITLSGVNMLNAYESMWSCTDVTLDRVRVRGDYFGMNSENIVARDLLISGNYAFDGGKNIEIRNARIISKDSFWNCENVTVYDSVIVGEYIGWNSKNVRFVNCDIESDQGFCYMDGLVLENCRLKNTPLAFEYSTVDADVRSHVDSVKNPISGVIRAASIGEIIHDPECVDVTATEIITEDK